MKVAILTVVLTTLVACSTDPNAPAEAVLAAYIGAASAESAYEALPTANTNTVATIKTCDNAAYAAIGPVSIALVNNQSVTLAVLTSAQSALTAFDVCLTTAGVKLQ